MGVGPQQLALDIASCDTATPSAARGPGTLDFAAHTINSNRIYTGGED
jgi:hypothetical protein